MTRDDLLQVARFIDKWTDAIEPQLPPLGDSAVRGLRLCAEQLRELADEGDEGASPTII